MNSVLVEDVQPWTNSKKQTKQPVSVNINIINVNKIYCKLYYTIVQHRLSADMPFPVWVRLV